MIDSPVVQVIMSNSHIELSRSTLAPMYIGQANILALEEVRWNDTLSLSVRGADDGNSISSFLLDISCFFLIPSSLFNLKIPQYIIFIPQ